MVTIAFDGDGTIWDCRREWYDTASEAWFTIEKTEFPMGYERFNEFIWSVVRPEHIMQNAKLASMNITLPTNINDLVKLRSMFDVFDYVNAFYNCRQKAMKDKENWLKKHKLYEGVTDMFKSLEKVRTNNVVVTSKDGTSTTELLKYFDIDKFIDEIYSKELGGRQEQFRCLSAKHKDHIVVYDDMPENLEVAKSFGFIPIAAPQGYSRQSDLAEYVTASPHEFVRIIRGLI